jgi:hypothetical protein
VTTTLSLGVEVGVGELDGGDLVELGTESGVLLGDHEDVNAVDQRKNGERPSETHDTLDVSLNLGANQRQRVDLLGRHRGTRGQGSLGGSSESPSSCRER